MLTASQIARFCQVDLKTIHNWADRGRIAPGWKADLNVIDYDALHIHGPKMVWDLPGNGNRLVQEIDGYRYTVKSGEVTYEEGKPTGALPGTLVRGPQPSPST